MIEFKNWEITAPGPVLARQRDCGCRELRVIGDLPDGYVWDLLVAVGGAMDVIRLSPVPGGVGIVLTAEQLSIAGRYQMQLRGTLGDVVKHTNIVQTFVSPSLSGDAHWPEVPSEFTQTEQRVLELYQHPPVPGSNGFWLVWDADKDEYVESQLPVSEGMDFATRDTAGIIKVGENLAISEDGVLSVVTTDTAQQDNTKPMTSAGVYTLAGNIEVLLAAL